MTGKLKYFVLMILFFAVQGSAFIIDASKNAVLHNDKGVNYLNEGYYLYAVQEFKLAIKLCPNSAATATFYSNLGKTYLKLGKYDWALSCFQKSININPNFIDYYTDLVKGYKAKNVLAKTADNYKQLVKRDKLNFKAWLVLGLVYKEMKKNDQALKCFNEFKKLEPDLVLTQAVNNISHAIK